MREVHAGVRSPLSTHLIGSRPKSFSSSGCQHHAAEWNGWSEEETLIQLADHLRGHALQEWGLLSASEKEEVSRAMRSQLDPCS